jgi:hypothetical protein
MAPVQVIPWALDNSDGLLTLFEVTPGKPAVRRLVGYGVLILGLAAIYVCSWWCALQLQAALREARILSARAVTFPIYPFILLWIWAECFETATKGRIPAPFGFACVSVAGVGILAMLLG